MNVTGRDRVLESIHEIRSLEVNCRAEGVSRIMNRQLLQMCMEAPGDCSANSGKSCYRPDRYTAMASGCDLISESVNKGSKERS